MELVLGQPLLGFPHPPAAEKFFKDVAKYSCAEIYWPSRLKIGAKTKKDPFVKVSGTAAQVSLARQLINSHLKIKRDRVTLKIEIHHSEHSKIIGRQGRNTQDIMRETLCHIHFPDSNKNHEVEKNDQVSISGSVEQVERARKWLRDLTPITVSFDLPNTCLRSIQEVQKSVGAKGLYIAFRENFDGRYSCVIKSTQQYEAAINKAFLDTVKQFQCAATIPCKTALTVRASLRAVINKDEQLRRFALQPATSIQYSPVGSDEVNIYVSGSIAGVLRARRYLIGLMPVSMHFDRIVETSNDIVDKAGVEATFRVSMSEKWRKNQNLSNASLVVLVGVECNIANLFRARERILNISHSGRDILDESLEETGSFDMQYILDPMNFDMLRPMDKNGDITGPISHCNEDCQSSSRILGAAHDLKSKYEDHSRLTDALLESAFNNQNRFEPKTPDPNNSPIAHSLLAGAKRIDEKRCVQGQNRSREQLLLKANRAIYDASPTPVRQPTDFWAGFGFSNSLPAEVSKSGLSGLFELSANNRFEGRPVSSQDPKHDATMPTQLTTGLCSVLEEDEAAANSSSNSNSLLSSSSYHNMQHLIQTNFQQSPAWRAKRDFSASTSVFESAFLAGNDFKWDIRDFVDPAMVLAQLGCSEYLPQFREQEIDMEAFLLLDEQSLKDIGVSTIGARKKLFNAILKLRESQRMLREGCGCNSGYVADRMHD